MIFEKGDLVWFSTKDGYQHGTIAGNGSRKDTHIVYSDSFSRSLRYELDSSELEKNFPIISPNTHREERRKNWEKFFENKKINKDSFAEVTEAILEPIRKSLPYSSYQLIDLILVEDILRCFPHLADAP